jgi:esterase
MSLNFHRQGQTDGSNKPVVLLHGLFGSLENLNGIAKSLHGRCEVIAIDLPNHGRSPHSNSFSYLKMADQVMLLMDTLGLDKYSIVGHSMGGKVAMQLAITAPKKVEKLVIADISPVAYSPKHNIVLEALKRIDLATVANRKAADVLLQPFIEELGIRNFLLKSLVKTPDGMAWRFNLQALIEHYPNINKGLEGRDSYSGPTLFVKGGKSDYIEAAHRPDIFHYFPNSKAHIIKDAGHWLHAEKPEQFNRIVSAFLFS